MNRYSALMPIGMAVALMLAACLAMGMLLAACALGGAPP